VAAHELTHAFDNTGSQYDEHGLLRNWWTNSTVEEFEKRAQCVAKQYSNYTITGPDGKIVHVNGNLTNGDDIGDSGIAFAYNAWKAAIGPNSAATEKLPGLNFTDDQLFFIASSRILAQSITPAAALELVRTDEHSPNIWRSNGPVSGFKKFAEVFNCPAGSTLNPKTRCDVWTD